jgi:ParB family chromosome partitioning protein
MMARKQSDYLAGLLSEDEEADAPLETKAMPDSGDASPPSSRKSTRSGGTTLLNRESALARVASGEVRQVTQLLLDPARVRIWPGNARVYADLSEEACRELIDSIIAEGGQKVPAVVRRVADDAEHEYEVIAGTRRHFATAWLRTHDYPEMRFLAQVADLDDEAAFRLADLENRARQDVTDLERARNYAAALSTYYEGRQARMAERLKLSKGWLSKMLRVAAIPDTVLAAFGSPADVQLKPAYPLAQALDDQASAEAIRAEAGRLAAEQSARRAVGQPPLPSSEVLRRLLGAPTAGKDQEKPTLFQWSTPHGGLALSVLSSNRQGVTIRLHPGSGATIGHLTAALEYALRDLEHNGMGLQP